MKKLIVVILIIILILYIFLSNFIYISLTGKVIQKKDDIYSFRKTVCNLNNYCQDYMIECKDKGAISIRPVEGTSTQYSRYWEDLRTIELLDEWCE